LPDPCKFRTLLCFACHDGSPFATPMKRSKKLLFDGKLIIDLVRATRNLCCLRSGGLLFFLGMHRALQRDHSVLRDDFDIVPIRGKRLVAINSCRIFFVRIRSDGRWTAGRRSHCGPCCWLSCRGSADPRRRKHRE
jgi:hypothetical protein